MKRSEQLLGSRVWEGLRAEVTKGDLHGKLEGRREATGSGKFGKNVSNGPIILDGPDLVAFPLPLAKRKCQVSFVRLLPPVYKDEIKMQIRPKNIPITKQPISIFKCIEANS